MALLVKSGALLTLEVAHGDLCRVVDETRGVIDVIDVAVTVDAAGGRFDSVARSPFHTSCQENLGTRR